MKCLFFLLLFVLLFGCANPKISIVPDENSEIIESTILWNAKLESDWTPVELTKLVSNVKQFEKQGAFYNAKSDFSAFGHKVVYLGIKGINEIAGPNASLIGTPSSIARYISDRYGVIFVSNEDKTIYESEYKKNIKLIIEVHPTLAGNTMVIGAYTGR